MILSFQIDNQSYKVDGEKPLDISIPLKFNGEQPNAYGVEEATSTPCEAGELVGDTREGGSCNFEQYRFIPHCNGTHTECVGHITNKRISVRDALQAVFIPATLISIEPENANETLDTYSVELSEQDFLITREAIEKNKSTVENSKALIIRTLPNSESKLSKDYGDFVPPFLSKEAMDLITEIGIKHLLVDLPSVDRIFDGGKLSNHRKFWNVSDGEFELSDESCVNNTITELIYVPNKIKNGNYLLNLQIAAFESDTSPSRPLLFKLIS